MTYDELANLGPGDVVQNCLSGNAYVVTHGNGSGCVAVKTLTVTNPSECEIVSKAHLVDEREA